MPFYIPFFIKLDASSFVYKEMRDSFQLAVSFSSFSFIWKEVNNKIHCKAFELSHFLPVTPLSSGFRENN